MLELGPKTIIDYILDDFSALDTINLVYVVTNEKFYPVFKTEDFISLANYSIYLKLMIDGKPSIPFSADTIL